ncbi:MULTISPECIES: molybdenum cofactor biosynthesis protein MoaE [Kocuria]|uniref:molybdenum cofactor biosynthesis protein MoaE n=1 Tax=Kocuria TaxID=57493 RepID=UPI00065FCEA1|nr:MULTISPECIES: molybdenum cofactor biosynthesis protein MoaE [Kocuria]MCT1367338.1 molybdenum cofactor biosynthesis protein MoaE [Rothia sp. p3-SID1597]RUQ23373.1 molybdenum cofactor biosynthesis protein MoaE [Kocuria sp. HSID16901]
MTTHESNGDPSRVAQETGRVIRADVVEEPLEHLQMEGRAATMTRAMGALVVFDGIVRDHDGGRDVSGLTYTAHPDVGEFMRRTAETVSARHADARLWAVHRIGPLEIGESALTVMAAAAHRGAAFSACEDLADSIKAEVPIWKEQFLRNGSIDWVGLDS